MAYCHEKAIPHGHFLGGPMVWTTEDRAKLIAYALDKADQCPRCNTSPWQWKDDPFAFEPILEICPGCQKLEAEDTDPAAKPPGATKRLVPKAVAARLREDPETKQQGRRRRRRV